MLPVYRPPRPRGASPPCQMANPTLNSEAQDSASMISFSDENPPPNPTSDNGGLWPIKKGEFSPNESQSDGEGSVGFQERKKHRRRPSKRRRPWKPYHNLNWEEKQQVDKKQSQRASRIQAEMFAKGHPVAPYNTTQFLMEDHNQEEPDLKIGLSPKRAAIKSDETSEEDFMELEGSNRIGPDGSEFLQKDFLETYEKYHVESLQSMSKEGLVKEYLELERCLSRKEEEIRRLQNQASSGKKSQVGKLEAAVEQLRAENLRLSKENELQGKGGEEPGSPSKQVDAPLLLGSSLK